MQQASGTVPGSAAAENILTAVKKLDTPDSSGINNKAVKMYWRRACGICRAQPGKTVHTIYSNREVP
jgi:hypothetical protein